MVNRTYWDSFDCEQQCEEYWNDTLETYTEEVEAQEERGWSTAFFFQSTAYKPKRCFSQEGGRHQ